MILYCILYSEKINFACGGRPCFKILGQRQVLGAGSTIFYGFHQGCLTCGENEVPKTRSSKLEMWEEGSQDTLPKPGVQTLVSPVQWEVGRETPFDHAGGAAELGEMGGWRVTCSSPFSGFPAEWAALPRSLRWPLSALTPALPLLDLPSRVRPCGPSPDRGSLMCPSPFAGKNNSGGPSATLVPSLTLGVSIHGTVAKRLLPLPLQLLLLSLSLVLSSLDLLSTKHSL